MIGLLGLATAALAIRPTEGGLFAFDAADEVVSWDEPTGRLRVHYAVAGPSVVDLADADLSGVPDYVELAGTIGAEALDLYESTGFRAPLNEADLGLGALGGSPALDVYLVDFGGSSDGSYGVDTCTSGFPVYCSGFLSVENDFTGYGYPSDEVALSVVVPHELFHGVQMAYNGELEVWASEGTAVWAERLYDPESLDFLGFAGVYLEEPTRSVDNPPVGPVPWFAYGTGLWFDFLTLQHDNQLVVELLEAWEASAELTPAMLETIEGRGLPIEDTWITFATWNLAVGAQSGIVDGYPYADRLPEVPLEAVGDALDDDNRFYPLATTYYRLNHGGGEVWFGLESAQPGLWISLHPTSDGTKDGQAEEAVVGFWAEDPGPRSLGELPAGQYFLWGAQPNDAANSIHVRFCAGDRADVEGCFGAPPAEDTGGDSVEEPGGGCGCATGGPSGLAGLLALGALARRTGGVRFPRRRTATG